MKNEMMKKTGKRLLALGLALSMVVLSRGVKAEAAEHVSGCTADYTVQCMGNTRTQGFSHFLAYGVNGESLYCDVTRTVRDHIITCNNPDCGYYIFSTRVCTESHESTACGVDPTELRCQY